MGVRIQPRSLRLDPAPFQGPIHLLDTLPHPKPPPFCPSTTFSSPLPILGTDPALLSQCMSMRWLSFLLIHRHCSKLKCFLPLFLFAARQTILDPYVLYLSEKKSSVGGGMFKHSPPPCCYSVHVWISRSCKLGDSPCISDVT